MTNELIADGIYRVSGMETSLKNGAWVSDAGTYLVTNQTKLADIPDARPGDIAFTAGYGHIWQLDVDSTTWVELPKTAAGTAATQAAASATAAAGSASAAATSASQAQTVAASIPADYTELSNSVVDLKSAVGYTGYPIETSGAYRIGDGSVTIGSPTANQYYKCATISCVPGDKFTISGKSYGAAVRLYGFAKSNGIIIEPIYPANETATNLELIAPPETAYLLVNEYQDTGYDVTVSNERIIDTVNGLKTAVSGMVNVKMLEKFSGTFEEGYFNHQTLKLVSGGYLASVEMIDGATYIINTSGTYNRFNIGVGDTKENNASLSERINGTAGTTNSYIYTNSNNHKYLFVWLNTGSDTFEATCSIIEQTGDVNYLKLNGIPMMTKQQTLAITDTLENVVGYDAYDFVDGYAVITPATGSANLTPQEMGSVSCVVIPCNAGDVFTLNGTPRSNSGTRPYMFVGTNNTVLYRSELTTEMVDYTVIAPANGKLVVNFLLADPHSVQKGYINISKKLSKYYIFDNEPLTNLPEYVVNNLSYKPVGALDKGYLCLSCDDGAVELGSYTIPMILEKEVPCTFSLWSTSAALADYTKDIVDAIANHGCELAQHGNQIWAEENGDIAFTESQLREFFATEAAYWATLGLTAKSAVCPAHYNNAIVRAVAGGTYGVVRSGLDYAANHYSYYSSGARSNLYCISSQNVNGGNLDYWKAAIDYAYDNNKILNIYWHDWDLSADQKTKLEAVIDYAKTKGITFCTLGDIANIL